MPPWSEVLGSVHVSTYKSWDDLGRWYWGLIKDHPDYLKVAQSINQIELYKQGSAAAKVSVPKTDMRTSKFIDGVTWDGKDPAKYADSFKVRGGTAA